MDPDDSLPLVMPADCRSLSVSQLLDRAFPASLDERDEMAAQFDLRANPDLPDIYAVFLAVCDEWRDWRCALRITTNGGREADLDALVEYLIVAAPEGPALALHLTQEYRALDYAVRHGFWPGRDELLDWMRVLTVLYFADKHEVELRPADAEDAGPGLRKALETLLSEGFVALRAAQEEDASASFVISRAGRGFIASLLTETESLIDQFDHFKDTLIDAEIELVEFDTGRGVDLRVEVFLAEGIDPVRAVFLLRLYDGSLDDRLVDWQEAVADDVFFEGLLEPVVNRDGAGHDEMGLVIESGLSLLEERQEQARREAAEREIMRRAEGEPPSS